MLSLILTIHVLIGVLLIIIILMQSGRGGGLTETFSGVESIFGTKTNTFLTRGTIVLAVIFLITSLSLMHLSRKQGESLLQKEISSTNQTKTISVPQEKPNTISQPIKPTEEPKAAQTVTVTTEQPTSQNIENSKQETKQQ